MRLIDTANTPRQECRAGYAKQSTQSSRLTAMRLLRQPEIARLTGSKDVRMQLRVLTAAGIQPIVRADGRLVVAEEAVLAAMQVRHTPEPVTGPNWGALTA